MHSDFLFIVAEIAAAFAGFASLAAVISQRRESGDPRSTLDFRTLQNVLMLSLMTVAFALMPSLLERQNLAPATVWRIAAGVYVAGVSVYVWYFLQRIMNAYGGVGRELPRSFIINIAFVFASIGSQIGVMGGFAPASTYLLAISVVLYCAGFGFVRLFVSFAPDADA